MTLDQATRAPWSRSKVSEPIVDVDVASIKAETAIRRASPYAQFQYITVTFNATPDTDTDIRHRMQPPDPEGVDFQVVGWDYDAVPTAAPVVYRDISATRRTWGAGYIILRCSEASVTARLLLTVRA